MIAFGYYNMDCLDGMKLIDSGTARVEKEAEKERDRK